MDDLKNKRVTVAGLGNFGGGSSVARWLVSRGARVLVTDRDPEQKLERSLNDLKGLPIEYRLGGHADDDFRNADLVVASPAIAPNNAFLQAARHAGIPVTTEIRLFVERCPARILGVTGTKGKSTTTAMLGHILKPAFPTWVGGNIGGSLLEKLPEIRPDHLVVLELSSYMLEYLGEARWSPHVALVTMVAPDHLDRHGTMDAYIAAKTNIVRFQRPDDFAVLNDAYDCSPFARVATGKIVCYGGPASRPFDIPVPGKHNQNNAQGAFAAAACLGITWEQAQAALRTFDSLPHRLQLVHEHAGVRYYNDSIATIPDAAVAALDSFPPRTVIQIVGGSDKKLDMSSMCAALAGRAKAALCIGAVGARLAEMIRAHDGDVVVVDECHDLPAAMRRAREIARRGDVILLSPGCASYGEFTNFEHRGDAFARLARE